MDDKKGIRLNPGEEELIDISIGYSVACSLYMIMFKGLEQLTDQQRQLKDYIEKTIPSLVEIPEKDRQKMSVNARADFQAANVIHKHGKEFFDEISRMIIELDPSKPKSKIIKPNWKG